MPAIDIYLTLFAVLVSSVTSEVDKSDDWQYLVFAQQWPTTTCLSQKTHKCHIPSYVSSWTVHGIWPTSIHGYPSFCNNSLTFNESAIKPIEDELLVVWPNLFAKEAVYSFWKHEWLKHGTCATSLPQLDTELKYFSEAIRAHKLYNILDFLKEDNIIPDEHTSYSVDDFRTAIERKTGKKAKFECKHVKGFDHPLILTVSICMDKNFTLIDCPGTEHSCKSSILYLPLPSVELPSIYIFHSRRYVSFSPTIYIVAGMALLFTFSIFMWFLISCSKNKERKMYTVLA